MNKKYHGNIAVAPRLFFNMTKTVVEQGDLSRPTKTLPDLSTMNISAIKSDAPRLLQSLLIVARTWVVQTTVVKLTRV